MRSHRWREVMVGLTALVCALAAAPAAHAAGQGAAIRGAIRRVETATVNDDAQACAQMSSRVRRELLASALTHGAEVSGPACRRAVHSIHATLAMGHELSSTRTIVREQLRTLDTSPVRFEFGRRASVIVIGLQESFDGSALQTTFVFGLQADGAHWRVTSLDEFQQVLQGGLI